MCLCLYKKYDYEVSRIHLVRALLVSLPDSAPAKMNKDSGAGLQYEK